MCAKIKVAGINELISIPDKQAQEIKDGLKSFMIKPDEFIEIGSWSGKAREIKSFIMESEQEEVGMWQKTTEELKEIAGDFREQLKEHTEGIPKTIHGKHMAVQAGLLPDIGGWWIEDRGIVAWYIQNGWLERTKKEGEKCKWSWTQKYVSDKIPQLEEATEELRCRRLYAEEQSIEHGDPIIKEIYEKEQREKIDALRKSLMVKLSL